MKFTLIRAGLLTSVVAGATLLSACGGATTAGSAAPAPTAPAATSEVAPSSAAPVASKTTAKQTSKAADTTANAASDLKDVDCGPLPAESNYVWRGVATATDAGIPGCTEVIDVLTDYFKRAPQESEGTSHALTVEGWHCLADTGTSGSGVVGCDKDGRAMRAER
ncbi:hypothetical protein [Amycolatopsis pithecellobii]|uniref:Uncharacterized protein n=1 Tax=Amycolatopsis pithecellobii TaxID=664692 RepID=A0A6N7YS30_9PSEU|nr:hypothetical protein [Amycolatopsis pithecellobii]MTD55835.1 hypothetical protein [Amycolatopsis pithecellobii]